MSVPTVRAAAAFVALLVVLLLRAAPIASAQGTATPYLRLRLFNDSACTVPSAVPGIDPPVAAYGVSPCTLAPSSLAALGYSSYRAACGVASNNLSFALASLFGGGATNCPNTGAPVTFISAGAAEDNGTHNSSACIGPAQASYSDNQTRTSTTVYAQWDCSTDSNGGVPIAYPVTALLLSAAAMMLWAA